MKELDVEGVFLVRARSIVGETRALEVRADAWPARAQVERDEGFFAEEALLLRIEPRAEVPFPLRLYVESREAREARDVAERVRKASRVLERARSLCVSRPRRAEQAFVALEPLFAALGPDAAGAMWIDAARSFAALGDVERARRSLGRLALLARRAPVSAELLARAALTTPDASTVPPELVEAAASRLSPEEGLCLRLGALAEKLAGGARVPKGALAAIDRAASTSADPEGAATQVDAALLGFLGLRGTWTNQAETQILRARLAPLWTRVRQTSPALRGAIEARLRAALGSLDAEGLSTALDFLVFTGDRGSAPLLLDVALRLLRVCPPGRLSPELDGCIRALLHLVSLAAPLFFENADELARALSLVFADPSLRPLCAALLADLDAAMEAHPQDKLSEVLGKHAGGALPPAEPGPPRSYRRTDRERAFARWIPSLLAEPLRLWLVTGADDASLAPLLRAPPLAFVACVRLVGLAQDERTERALAEDALRLADALASRIDADPLLANENERLADVDPTLELLDAADLDALRAGLVFTWTNLHEDGRRALRPQAWPAPVLAGLSDPRDARAVFLTWVFGRLEAREVGRHHLAFARIAASTALVRAAAGRLVPAQQATRGPGASSLAHLVPRAVARFPALQGGSLDDVVLLCPPRALAEAFALDAGLSPRAFGPSFVPDKPASGEEPRDPPPLAAPLPAALDLDPARELTARLARSLRRAPFAAPSRDPALPLAPVIAGHPVSIGPHGEIVAHGARGSALRRVPRVVQQDEAYRALVRGRHSERSRKRAAAASLEARMTSAAPIAAAELACLLDDPAFASLLRHLVVTPISLAPGARSSFFLLYGWDRSRGLGLVPLDYDARFAPFCDVELVHPTRLVDLQAWRALLEDLGVRQGLTQLFRDLRAVPDDELDRAACRALAGKIVGSSAALLHALSLEGFSTGRGLATRSFVHHGAPRPFELWFDVGDAPWPEDPALSGAFGFRERGGDPLAFRDVPRALVCEGRASIERALARAATRAR